MLIGSPARFTTPVHPGMAAAHWDGSTNVMVPPEKEFRRAARALATSRVRIMTSWLAARSLATRRVPTSRWRRRRRRASSPGVGGRAPEAAATTVREASRRRPAGARAARGGVSVDPASAIDEPGVSPSARRNVSVDGRTAVHRGSAEARPIARGPSAVETRAMARGPAQSACEIVVDIVVVASRACALQSVDARGVVPPPPPPDEIEITRISTQRKIMRDVRYPVGARRACKRNDLTTSVRERGQELCSSQPTTTDPFSVPRTHAVRGLSAALPYTPRDASPPPREPRQDRAPGARLLPPVRSDAHSRESPRRRRHPEPVRRKSLRPRPAVSSTARRTRAYTRATIRTYPPGSRGPSSARVLDVPYVPLAYPHPTPTLPALEYPPRRTTSTRLSVWKWTPPSPTRVRARRLEPGDASRTKMTTTPRGGGVSWIPRGQRRWRRSTRARAPPRGVSIARIPSQAPLEELDEPAVGALQHLCEVFCAREASLSPGVGRRARRAGRVEEMFAAAGAIERGTRGHPQGLHDARQLLRLVLTWKQGIPGVELCEDAPETPHVDGLVVGSPEDYLRGAIKSRLDVGVRAFVLEAAAAEVDHLDGGLVRFAQQNVFGFEVAVDHPLASQELERLQQLRGESADEAERKPLESCCS